MRLFLALLLLIPSTSFAAKNYCYNDAKGCWLMNEGTGTTTADSSYNSNIGNFTSSGHPAWSTDVPNFNKSGKPLFSTSFTSTDSINCGSGSSLDDISGALTVVFWMKKTTSASGRSIMSKYSGGGWDITVDASTTNIFFEQSFSGNTVFLGHTGSSVFTSGTWTHVAVTYDGSTNASGAHIYKNGAEVSYSFSNNGSGARDSDASASLKISDIYDAYYDGLLADVGVFNRVLSTTEINEIYNYGLTGGSGNMLLATQ